MPSSKITICHLWTFWAIELFFKTIVEISQITIISFEEYVFTAMEWPNVSSDLNPVENVWDMIDG